MENNNCQINRELDELNKEKYYNKLSLEREQERLSNLFKNGMGSDIDNVLSGQEIVKLTFYEKVKYKIRNFLDTLFNII